MSGGSLELLEVQQKLQKLSTEYDKLNDEWAGRLAAQQAEFQRDKHALLQDSSARIQATKDDAEAKNAEIVAELDKLRRAFTGDTLGWASAQDEEGKPYYYNAETGESDYDKPRILEIAEVVQNMDALDEGKKKQEKAIKKGKEAELHSRKLEVSLNEIRLEAAGLRKTKKEWEACGKTVTSLCTAMSTTIDDVDVRVKKVEERVLVVNKAVGAVKVATAKVCQLKKQLNEQDATIQQLRQDLSTAAVEIESTRERADKLEARFTQAVEERVDEVKLPLEDELAAAYAGRQDEKALRESDRRYLADLWPEGWLVPSMLRKFRTMTAEERAQQTLRMEEVEAERDLLETIRAGVAAAAKWEENTDDYGRAYYTNWETGEAVYDPPPEMAYRPPLGRNELGQRVDPRLQALREWERRTDGWGKPFWQNARSGDVVQIEPKGWSEAMGLEEHELEGWEGPAEGEVAKDVAVEAARVVITWLNKAREAEEKRMRAVAEPLGPDNGNGDGSAGEAEDSEEDDSDHDEFVYDIQSVEELAMGDIGWRYEGSLASPGGDTGNEIKADDPEGDEEVVVGVEELRSVIAELARREDRFEGRLKQIRRNLEDLAHDLLAAKKREELETHGFAVGHTHTREIRGKAEGRNGRADTDQDGQRQEKRPPEGPASLVAATTPQRGGGDLTVAGHTVGDDNEGTKRDEGTTSAATVADHGKGQDTASLSAEAAALVPATSERASTTSIAVAQQRGGQAAGEAAIELGVPHATESNEGRQIDDPEQSLSSPNQPTRSQVHKGTGRDKAVGQKKKSNPRALPDSLAQEIETRAFPLAEGISCAAFHTLAAEAVWAGFNGLAYVEKPPDSVWDPRGCDRWGTAAFFAETLDEREEEAVPGLPHTKILQLNSEDVGGSGGGGCSGGGGHPLCGTSARHAEARALCLAAVSSRRGYLKQAEEVAAKEARQHMRNVTEDTASSREIIGECAQQENGVNATYNSVLNVGSSGGTVGLNEPEGIGAVRGVGEAEERSASPEGRGGDGDENPVIRSAVMLEFGAHMPGHTASACGKAMQLPIPDEWDNPEARENQYAAQKARRKQAMEDLCAKDKALLVKPKGYVQNKPSTGHEGSTRPRGCQDARELLRYEAVVLEEILHMTLVQVNEVQGRLEAGRRKATERWDQLIKSEGRVIARLSNEILQQQTGLAKLSMEIRGLRVPLIEPQPPPPPTLDPGGMKPPSPVPDAQKMRTDEVDDLAKAIRGGKYDTCEEILLPQGKTLSAKQLEEITVVIRQRRAEVVILLEEKMVRHNEEMAVYEYKHREWQRVEIERKERLSAQCHKSRLDTLKLDTLVNLKGSRGEHLALLRVEASADESIAAQSQEAKRRFEATLAKQIAEEARAYEWLLRLQVELSDALRDREALVRLPDASLHRLDSLRWEQRRAGKMVECRRRVAELRESLIEEGRRRRQLYDEKRWAAQSELRRVLAEKAAVEEKESMVRLLLKVGEATLASRASALNARNEEATGDKEGKGTEGSVSPGEAYSSRREWVSKEFQQADVERKAWEEKLAEILQIRGLARRRETTVCELVLGAARGALPPPHPDQWLPKAEQQRHEDEIRLLQERHQRELLEQQQVVEASHTNVRKVVREAAILKAKLKAIEGWRDHEILTLRTAGHDAANNLKGLLEKQRKESATRIDKLEQALSELRKEYNEVRAELTARIEELNRGRSNLEAWVKALRHELASERVKRETADERVAFITDNARVVSEKLRTELRRERMHSLRLELWIAALHDEIRLQEKAQAELKRQRALDKEEHERKLREERHIVWRHRTAVRLLCTSVDSLFLFFAQRLANLAGSRRTHNDALHSNGAVEVLAAVCRGPRKDLRRLAARALGALGWDGHTEARVLAWDIYRHWDLWVESCCPAEEARLRRRGRTFEDPEEFRHADQLSSPALKGVHPAKSLEKEEEQETRQQQQQQQQPRDRTSLSNEGDTDALSGVAEPYLSVSGDEVTERTFGHEESGALETPVRDGSQENENATRLGRMDICALPEADSKVNRQNQEHGGGAQTRQKLGAEPRTLGWEKTAEEDDDEFRPWAAMSARTVVRERRQWALRRARRREGPNEANQLELGGGPGVVGNLWGTTATDGGGEAKEERLDVTVAGGGNVVALLVRLCQERDDWEVVRAAAAALSVAAYHELNAVRMGKAAPGLISVLVGLLPHPDAEVQAHAATALANLAYGSPSYQSEAGEAGAIGALLDVCRGRAGSGGGNVHDGTSTAVPLEVEKEEKLSNDRREGSENASVVGKQQEKYEMGERWARKRQEVDRPVPTTVSTDTAVSRVVRAQNEDRKDKEVDEEGLKCDGQKGGEEGRTTETMDVDAVQAATSALANLLCYSDANSVRLVAAAGIGVLVGLVSSYKPHNLLDFDQAEEIQANAAEALVNATRNHGEEAAARIHALGVGPLVLMCGSSNLQVKRHAALVLGNVCQTDAHRATAGEEGAVEGLFSICDTDDGIARANALWALGNLAWDPRNQERIGRYTAQLVSLVSTSWLPVRANALVCLGNCLFFHEPNRRRVEKIDGALLMLLGYCGRNHPPPVQEAALRCVVSLTYVDRIVAPLAEAGCIPTFVASLATSAPAAVRHSAALALLNVSVNDRYKAKVAEAGGVEAAVALLGSDDPEERELAAKILEALASTEADDEAGRDGSGKKQQLDIPHLLGIVQTDGNPPAQKGAAEQIAHAVSNNPCKQQILGNCGGVTVLLGICDPKHKTEASLLVPVLWGLRNGLHNNATNKDRFVRAKGLETLVQLCHSSRLAGEWAVAEGVLTTLVTAALGNEKICRRLLRVGLDQLLDAAEDHTNDQQQGDKIAGAMGARPNSTAARRGGSASQNKKRLPAMPGRVVSHPPPTADTRGPASDAQLGLDQIDEIGVDGVLHESSDALARDMQGESRETCSALATSLLQVLGPFNYVICGHCGAREGGGATCSQCGYAIAFDFSVQGDGLTSPLEQITTPDRKHRSIAYGH